MGHRQEPSDMSIEVWEQDWAGHGALTSHEARLSVSTKEAAEAIASSSTSPS